MEGRWQERRRRKRLDRDNRKSDGNLALLRLCRCNEVFAARKSSLTAIVIGGRHTLPPFAAIGGFLRELGSAGEAVEGLEQQEHCYQADHNMNATAHSI